MKRQQLPFDTLHLNKLRDPKPCGHRILVKIKEVETIDKKGEIYSEGKNGVRIITEILTPSQIEADQEAFVEGYVVELGETAYKYLDGGEPWCKVGDCILMGKFSGVKLRDVEENHVYRIIRDDDVICVFRGEEKC